jgi:hypothetical protein
MNIEKIKELALANGFKLKEQADGSMDLNAYVYDFANSIEQAAKVESHKQAALYQFEINHFAKAQAAPEWISTEDKEPVENGNYLVCIDGDVFYLTAKWVKNHFKFLARGYGLTEDFTDWRYCEGVKVTHWMSLPDSPKAQEPAND